MTACVHCGEPAVPGYESPHGLEHCSDKCLAAAGAAAGLAPPDEVDVRYQYWRDSHGWLHRDYDLPAVVSTGGGDGQRRVWHRGGVRHRDGGRPAIVHRDGHVEYWLDGVHYSDGTYAVRLYG